MNKNSIEASQEVAQLNMRVINLNKDVGILLQQVEKKQKSLEDIAKACQRIKDNPNVAYILKLAEEGAK